VLDTVHRRGLCFSYSELFVHAKLYLQFAIVCIVGNGGHQFAMLLAGMKQGLSADYNVQPNPKGSAGYADGILLSSSYIFWTDSLSKQKA
jgi:hypothetical protein